MCIPTDIKVFVVVTVVVVVVMVAVAWPTLGVLLFHLLSALISHPNLGRTPINKHHSGIDSRFIRIELGRKIRLSKCIPYTRNK